MVGGYTLIAAMLANLLTAHAFRFKARWGDLLLIPQLAAMLVLLWFGQANQSLALTLLGCLVGFVFVGTVFRLHAKRTGIILTHLALILLLGSEVATSRVAVESMMQIEEGETKNYSYDVRDVELAVIDTQSSPHYDNVVAVPRSQLKPGAVIEDPNLPFQVRIDHLFKNSDLLDLREAKYKDTPNPADSGDMAQRMVAKERAGFSGVGDEASRVDIPSAYVTLTAGGKSLGTYLLTSAFPDWPQTVLVDGKPYDIALRFRR